MLSILLRSGLNLSGLNLGVSFGAAALVGYVAKRLGWLTTGGAVAAAFVGGSIFAFTGWQGAAVLLLFFVTSSLLTRLNRGHELTGKGGPRDARQVLANGLVASLAAVWAGSSVWGRLAMAGALAAATADTWATEIGIWSKGVPRSALTARAVAPGESGGMTTFGTFGGLVGAALIAAAAVWMWDDLTAAHAVAIEWAGFAGMWFDSLLGAGVQYQAYCAACGRTLEDPHHTRRTGHPVVRRRGLRFFDNDMVNVMATLAGAAMAVLVGG